jgi:hypothetical protein
MKQEKEHIYRICIYVDLRTGKKLMKWTEKETRGGRERDCWASGQREAASSAKSPLYKNGITFIRSYIKTF